MKARLLCLSLFLLFALSGVAAPVQPLKPITLVTEFGQVAGTEGKIKVEYFLVISRDDTKSFVTIAEKDTFGATVMIEGPQLGETINALREVVDAIFKGEKSHDANIAVGKIGAVSERNMSLVGIWPKPDGKITMARSHLFMDIDNAESLLRMLERGAQNAEWIEGRAKAFLEK